VSHHCMPKDKVRRSGPGPILLPSLAAYKEYRTLFGVGPDFIASDKIRVESQCVLRYELSFMRPILDAAPGA